MDTKVIKYVNILDLVQEDYRDGVAEFIGTIEDMFWFDDYAYSYVLACNSTVLERLTDCEILFEKADFPEGWEQLKTAVENLDPDIQIEINRRFN